MAIMFNSCSSDELTHSLASRLIKECEEIEPLQEEDEIDKHVTMNEPPEQYGKYYKVLEKGGLIKLKNRRVEESFMGKRVTYDVTVRTKAVVMWKTWEGLRFLSIHSSILLKG